MFILTTGVAASCAAAEAACCICSSACCFGQVFNGGSSGRIASLWLVISSMAAVYGVQHYNGAAEMIGSTLGWACCGVECGRELALRVGEANVLFFLLQAALARTLDFSFHDSSWGLKYAGYIGIALGSALCPSSLVSNEVPTWLIRIAAMAYTGVQSVLLSDTAVKINDAVVSEPPLRSRAQDLWTTKQKALLFVDILIGAAAFFSVGDILYSYHGSSCNRTQLLMGISLILTIGATTVQLSDTAGAANFLASVINAAYVTSLARTGVHSDPGNDCHRTDNTDLSTVTNITIAVFTMSVMCTAQDPVASRVNEKCDAGKLERVLTGTDPVYGSITNDDRTDQFGRAGGTTAEFWQFDLIMAMASSFGCVALSQFAAADRTTALWLWEGSSWLASLVYIWVVSAPRLFPNRDFS